MDGNRFDALARTLGAGRSRRGALKTLLGGALGGAAVVLGGSGADAAPKPPKPPAPDCCPTGFPKLCGSPGTCTATPTDPANCGACGNVCPTGASCANGVCACLTGQTVCNNACVNVKTDPNNCGVCGTSCARPHETTSCSNGTCVFGACASGFGNCDLNSANGCETDLNTSHDHCGACGHACPANGTCESGLCNTPPTCSDGFKNGTETDIDCGGSCPPCAVGKTCQHASDCASGLCCGGVCVTESDSNCGGGCVNCQTGSICQRGHCDLSQHICIPANQGTICANASCVNGTATSAAVCDGAGACQTSTQTSCGAYACNGAATACNTSCASDQDCAAGNHCSGGTCVAGVATCTTAADCPTPNQCHTVTCTAGVCETALKTNGTPCDDGNACTRNDTCQNGFCVGGAPVVCTASDQCHQAGTCDPTTGCSNLAKPDGAACGTGDACCGGACLNLSIDLTNCGACGHVCSAANATPVCNAAVCGIAGCNSGYMDCNGDPSDGCEVNTASDPNNCGACNNVCGSGQTCHNSACVAVGKADGQTCLSSTECTSGFCANGVCCNNACTGVCQACIAAQTGGANGTCAAVTNGTDPNGSCADQGSVSCGTNGLCQNGACAFYPSSTICAPASCSNGTATLAATCNGAGSCVTPVTQPCAPYICAGNACTTTCANDAGCVAGAFCDGSGHCVPDLPNGGSCASDSQCVSGFCVNNLCAAAPCSGCTVGGVCYLTGAANPTNPCQACNPSLTTSAFSNVNGIPCSDGSLCIRGDTCLDGVCQVASQVDCSEPPDQCHVAGACIPATGQCSYPLAPDGTVCTIGGDTGHCSAGVCVAG